MSAAKIMYLPLFGILKLELSALKLNRLAYRQAGSSVFCFASACCAYPYIVLIMKRVLQNQGVGFVNPTENHRRPFAACLRTYLHIRNWPDGAKCPRHSCLQESPKTAHRVLWFSVLTTSGLSDDLLEHIRRSICLPRQSIHIYRYILNDYAAFLAGPLNGYARIRP